MMFSSFWFCMTKVFYRWQNGDFDSDGHKNCVEIEK